ncbi:DUF7504 family protein [Natronomonas amylolytica]|uniref:DUF7504 family protein n=1 Tax=Natronomonas amylolytica TaxID=3108498 RepID=UPI0030080408
MYSTRGAAPVPRLPGGSSYLCLGPPMVGMDGLLAAVLTPREGEASIAVLTDTDPKSFLERMDDPEGPVAIVDCTGEEREADGLDDRFVRRVSSPADLTSIGIAVSEFLDPFVEGGLSVRVGLDSLTTLSVYVERKQLFAFLNVLEPRATGHDGLFVAALYTESVAAQVQSTVEPLFDGRIELREGATGSEIRIEPPGEDPTDWEPFESDIDRVEAVPSTSRESSGEPTVDSLGALIRRVEATRLTLSVYNPGGTDLGPLRTRMDRLNVTLESIETPKVPEGVAMLHRNGEFLVAEPLGALLSSLSLDELQVQDSELSPIIDHVDSTVTGLSVVEKPLLVRASRMFELLAYRTGQGTLHVGFQELSRVADDEYVTRLYENIVGSGVDIRVYGAPDATIPLDGVEVIESENEEITGSWFVVFEGGGRSGTLLCEEREPESYHGFWTRRPELVGEAAAYLEATY